MSSLDPPQEEKITTKSPGDKSKHFPFGCAFSHGSKFSLESAFWDKGHPFFGLKIYLQITHFYPGVDFVNEKLSKGQGETEERGDAERARDKAISDSVRSGAAGVTGEDFGIDQRKRAV